jgi:hypothetical protein
MTMNDLSRPALLFAIQVATTRLRAALTLALIALSCNAAAQDTAGGIRYGVAPAMDCREIGKTAAKGSWVEANGSSVEFGAAVRARAIFSDPVATDMLHASMNGVGARTLALVETEDPQGGWHKVWEGTMQPPAPGFEQTCFEQRLPHKQLVQALRFTFRATAGQVDVNHAALLRR